jgi:hypothetical protein
VWMLLFGGVVMAESGNVEHPNRVVLVGASIGKDWHFDRIGKRVELPGYRFHYVGVYSFVKGSLIQKFVNDPDKPDIVLIKECTTFFPGDTEQYQHQFMSWVESLRAVDVQVVIVTTAPVAEPTEYVPRAKIFVKRLIRKPTQLDSIVQFNEWLKEYAQRGRIPVFDLGAQLQRSNSERWLRSEYGGVLDLDLTALDRQAEFIAINKQPNDDVVHLDSFRKADRLAHQTLDTCA